MYINNIFHSKTINDQFYIIGAYSTLWFTDPECCFQSLLHKQQQNMLFGVKIKN